MSHMSRTNGKRVAASILLSPFLAYYVLAIGIHAKKAKVIAEGAIYATVFTLAIALPTGFLGQLPGFLAFAAVVASGIRTYQLRDLWLLRRPPPYSPVRAQAQQTPPPQLTNPPPPTGYPFATQAPPPLAGEPVSRQAHKSHHSRSHSRPQPQPQPQQAAQQAPSNTSGASSALVWVSSTARNNKYRLPSEAYVSILETCNTLDSLVEIERVEPSKDASFEYELNAMVTQYLPGVLKGYLAIPPSMVEEKQPNGKTPNDELVEQLDLLSGQADNLHSTRHGQATAELSSMGNFLRDRFGHQSESAFDFGIE